MSARSKRNARRVRAQGILLAGHVAQAKYIRQCKTILGGVHRATQTALEPHLGEIAKRADTKAPVTSWRTKMAELAHRIKSVREPAGKAFDQMAQRTNKANYEAASVLLGLRPQDTGAAEYIAEARAANIELMEAAGRDYLEDVQSVLEDPDTFGLRVEQLRDRLLERADVSKSRAALIARDQTLKLNGALNRVRQVNAGVEKYTWSTSHDERVRESHAELDGEVFSWDAPPEPGHPGEDFQCRCVAIPVLPGEEDDQEDNDL